MDATLGDILLETSAFANNESSAHPPAIGGSDLQLEPWPTSTDALASGRMSTDDVAVRQEDEALMAALKAWQVIDLATLQKQLDVQGLEIVENQKESIASRKRLAEQTKEFRKVPDDEKLSQFKVLLKGYQTEIDNITKRSKTAETAFLNLYKHLAEAPDPAPIIASVSDHSRLTAEVASLQAENKRLKEELLDSEKELVNLRGTDGSIQTLKSRLAKYEAMLDEMVAEKVLAKEIEMKQVMDEKIRIYKETEYSLQRQLNLAKDELIGLKATHDVTQARLVDNTRQFDHDVAVKLGELEIVTGDLERANGRVSQLERENELLKKDLANFRGEGSHHARGEWQDPVTLARKVKTQDGEISKLLEELEKQRISYNEKETMHTRRVTELERESAVRKLEMEQMREKMLQYDDYDQIKHELDVMKHIEFSNPEAAASSIESLDIMTTSGTGEYVHYSLEKLLMDKNKRLQGEVTSLKLSLLEAQETIAATHTRLEAFRSKSETQAKLIQKLEDDMYKLNTLVANPPATTAASQPAPSGPAHMDPLSSLQTGAEVPADSLSAALSIPSAMSGSKSHHAPAAASVALPVQVASAIDATANTSIVPILASQRDRYRQRNSELEEQHRTMTGTIADLKNSLESLKADNLKLYEKLKFAESFSTTNANNSNTSSSASNRRTQHNSQSSPVYSTLPITNDDVTSRYSQAYEGNLDPFRRFHRQEEARRIKELNPAERALLMMSQFLASSRLGRFAVVGYCIVLHVLVFMMLMFVSSWECRHDHEFPLPPPKNA